MNRIILFTLLLVAIFAIAYSAPPPAPFDAGAIRKNSALGLTTAAEIKAYVDASFSSGSLDLNTHAASNSTHGATSLASVTYVQGYAHPLGGSTTIDFLSNILVASSAILGTNTIAFPSYAKMTVHNPSGQNRRGIYSVNESAGYNAGLFYGYNWGLGVLTNQYGAPGYGALYVRRACELYADKTVNSSIGTYSFWVGIDGKVGIGTSTPGEYDLFVDGNTRATNIEVGTLASIGTTISAKNNLIQIGTVDPYGRTQIWNKAPNASLRLGSLEQDGDPAPQSTSEGIVIYGENSNATFTNQNWAYARIKANRFGLLDCINNTQTYVFRVDHTELYTKNNSGVKTFRIDRATGDWYSTGTMTAGIIPWARINGTPTTIAGYGIIDAASITALNDHILSNNTHSCSTIASESYVENRLTDIVATIAINLNNHGLSNATHSCSIIASQAYVDSAIATCNLNLADHIASTGSNVHGLGTISTQNANAVAITGGVATLSALQITTNPANGYVLTSDSAGNASWQPSSGSGSSDYYVGDKETLTAYSSAEPIPVNAASESISIASGACVWAHATIQCVLSASGTASVKVWKLEGCFENLDNTLSVIGTTSLTLHPNNGFFGCDWSVSGNSIGITASGPTSACFQVTRLELKELVE